MSLSREQIWQRIQGELASPKATATEQSRLRDDLGLSSLKTVDLVIKLEEAFDVNIADEELMNLATISDLIDLIEAKIRQP